MMWEVCRDKVIAGGGKVIMESPVTSINFEGGRAVSVTVTKYDGTTVDYPASHVISTMPMNELVGSISPEPPTDIMKAGTSLSYRDFLSVALVVPEKDGFPDNWIYIHEASVAVGRIQNYGSWSPYMVKEGRTCLGLEYFVFEGDEIWSDTDENLIERAKREMKVLGLLDPAVVEHGYVVRVKKAYPYYDYTYKDNVAHIAAYLEGAGPNVHLVGRNGMHKYNNQDHSMLTAILTVENIYGADHDIWEVNVEEEYHEAGRTSTGAGTGRDAPILPPRGEVS